MPIITVDGVGGFYLYTIEQACAFLLLTGRICIGNACFCVGSERVGNSFNVLVMKVKIRDREMS